MKASGCHINLVSGELDKRYINFWYHCLPLDLLGYIVHDPYTRLSSLYEKRVSRRLCGKTAELSRLSPISFGCRSIPICFLVVYFILASLFPWT